MLTWIQTQAKWVIVIFIVFITAGLLLIDQQSLSTDSREPVATIDGRTIDFSEYSRMYQNAQARMSANMSQQDLAQLRRRILKENIQQHKINEILKELDLKASGHEILQYMLNNPHPGFQKAPIFMTDSVFDIKKWQAFVLSDSAANQRDLVDFERMIEAQNIPMSQLQQVLAAGIHTTDLEAKFKVEASKNRFKLQYLSASLDSFKVEEPKPEAIEAYFIAQKDSFYVTADQAKAEMLYVKVVPSQKDIQDQKKYLMELKSSLKTGRKFSDLARDVSEDEGSATQGGSLGGWSNGSQWVKPFRDAALQLDSGEVSGIVSTRFGFHILKSVGKKDVEGETQVLIQHILVKVTPGTETVDSLEQSIDNIREEAVKAEDWSKFAGTKDLIHKKTDWFIRGGAIKEGYFPGLSTFTFDNEDKKVSKVIKNDGYIAVFKPLELVEAGERLLGPNREAITEILKVEAQAKLAQEYLKSLQATLPNQLAQLRAFAEINPKVNFDSTSWISSDASVARFGFSNPKIANILKANKNKWIALNSGRYAFLAKWSEKKDALAKQIEVELPRARKNLNERSQSMAMNSWMNSLESQVEVSDNLGTYYPE